ncbi:ethylmalonyl-CoA decarboxylase-like [Eriocheir sinensis]|uniref:ethylmalonyl-CoA decarboxylase-like n=1 Tax=Eriocheir sinensis TaxID=95602 RepID=UPI0021CA50C4|nr:ethylmalonyl-CoA decarboxylase-like [Eriocheir sinensis]
MLSAVLKRKGISRGVSREVSRGCASLISQARGMLEGLGDGEVTLEKDVTSGVATITLRNERRKNALSGRMMVQLADITHELTHWAEGKAVVLTSEGDTFCSGGDLTTVKAICDPDSGLLMSTLMHDALTRLYTLPHLTLTLVHGAALGGGAELTTATDFRVFTETGVVGFVQGRMGVTTGWGGGTRLVKLLGPSATLDLLTTCRKIDHKAAVNIGLADYVVASEGRNDAALGWLSERIGHATEVVQAAKRIAVAARDLPVTEALSVERGVFAPLWGGPANLRALGKNIKHK